MFSAQKECLSYTLQEGFCLSIFMYLGGGGKIARMPLKQAKSVIVFIFQKLLLPGKAHKDFSYVLQSLLLLTYLKQTFKSFSQGFIIFIFCNLFFLLTTVCTMQLVKCIRICLYLLVVMFLSAATFLYLYIDCLPPPPRIQASSYLFLPGKCYMFFLDVTQNKVSAQ